MALEAEVPGESAAAGVQHVGLRPDTGVGADRTDREHPQPAGGRVGGVGEFGHLRAEQGAGPLGDGRLARRGRLRRQLGEVLGAARRHQQLEDLQAGLLGVVRPSGRVCGLAYAQLPGAGQAQVDLDRLGGEDLANAGVVGERVPDVGQGSGVLTDHPLHLGSVSSIMIGAR
ncbi:hypothetical protein [Streptomyces virginiae]|uniref:hypothetical protein n=1 Tax=Streptomyces virginiae TaxID=1961 RepID=UPI0022518BC7|nr:hypothetical protein [Streptomyces virginiae]MCX5174587.1 hypothetical protein [Streptomyces virginiae]